MVYARHGTLDGCLCRECVHLSVRDETVFSPFGRMVPSMSVRMSLATMAPPFDAS